MSTAPALPATMRTVVMRTPDDVVVEDVEVPRVVHPTDVVLKIEAACVCGSDLWPYRGLQPVENRRMGHEYVGTVVEAGTDVKSMRIGDFVIGSFMVSDNTCEICRAGYPSRCANAGSYIVYILSISAVATICESVSYGGIDNLTVPSCTAILYYIVATLL